MSPVTDNMGTRKTLHPKPKVSETLAKISATPTPKKPRAPRAKASFPRYQYILISTPELSTLEAEDYLTALGADGWEITLLTFEHHGVTKISLRGFARRTLP